MAKQISKELEKHGHSRNDPYYWLNDREDPEVIAYLEAENAYTEKVMGHTASFQEKLFEEIKARIKQTDESVPYKLDDYYYYTRFVEGQEYPIYCRRKGTMEAAEEVMLDCNALAEGHAYYNVRGRQVSSNQDILAYAEDRVGRRIYTIKFKNLTTGEAYPDVIEPATGNMAWANDNRTLFYTRQDPVTLRSFQVYKHVLGTDAAEDVLIYEEKDETFRTFVTKFKSKRYLAIGSTQTLSSEYRILDADNPDGAFQVFRPRSEEHEYHIEHFEDHFFIYTNDKAKNFRVMKTPVNNTAMENWQEVIPHREDVYLENFEIFQDFFVLQERSEGLTRLRIMPWRGEEHYVDFGEPAYDASISTNLDFNTRLLRYSYTSLTTPSSVYDYDMQSREKTLLKREEVLGDFDPANYKTERLWATARDGTKIPISMVYRNGMKKDGQNPLLLYGYGSYGATIDASFRSYRLSLLDRGFVFAIAHVRGGQMLGRQWYEDGKMFKKKNSFTDFIDCARYLVDEKYTNPDKLFAEGRSAGGLLMGAVANMAPDQFKGILAGVPFVDVVTTMLDDSIPLTTNEYDEWGNPNKKEEYDYILSYSPYDNVAAQDYPHMLVTTGLHDSQVQYWEPAKWVAKLRTIKTDDNLLLLKTNMEAGHGGASGRYERYKEISFEYAFILDLVGIRE